jgi:ribosome-associated toxin RatA of RatAB toxin-antitoxin module
MPISRSLPSLAAAALALALAFGAHAGPGGYAPPAADAQAVELFKLARDKKTHFTDPATKQVWGRGQIFVDAPMSDVRAAILDYGNWSQFMKRFQKSKLLKKEGNGAAEVYLQMPILKGAATLWAVEKFDAPVADGKGEKIVGHFQKGNVEDLQAVWRYRPVDDRHTVVQLDIYVMPKLAVPAGLMVSQREDAAGEACIGVKERAQQTASFVAVKKP